MRIMPAILLLSLVAAGPATRPAADEPRGTVEALTNGLATGDAAAIRGALYATTDPERHMVDAMVAMSEAIARGAEAMQLIDDRLATGKVVLDVPGD